MDKRVFGRDGKEQFFGADLASVARTVVLWAIASAQ
jgi:hypothetical protein